MSTMNYDTCSSVEQEERDDDKVSGLLVNVFGLKLPNDMFSQAARSDAELADILKEYANALENSKR